MHCLAPAVQLLELVYVYFRPSKWNGVFNPMKLAMRPMKEVQLNVSTFHTGEVA